MISIGRFSYIIRVILPTTLALLMVFLSGCSKMTWTLGGTEKIDEERVTQVTDEKDLRSSHDEEDIGEDGRISGGEDLINRETTDIAKASNLPIRSDLKMGASLEDVYFDFDKHIIRNDYLDIVKKDAEWLSSNPDKKIVIEGQADQRGTTEYNLALGERRAQSVKRHLVTLGVEPFRINTISYGEEKPVCTEHTEECWWKNRRAHFAVNE